MDEGDHSWLMAPSQGQRQRPILKNGLDDAQRASPSHMISQTSLVFFTA